MGKRSKVRFVDYKAEREQKERERKDKEAILKGELSQNKRVSGGSGKVEKYHYQIGFPQKALAQVKRGKMRLTYSYHAQQEAMRDRYGVIDLPKILDTFRAKVIEIETQDEKVIKVLYRTPHDTERDLVLAVIPEGGNTGKVKTVWINTRHDTHRTLDRSKYSFPYKP